MILNRILKETVVHPHICDPRDETYRLEEQGWEHNLWNAIDIDSCMEEGTFSIDVGFFDYTYCVGHEVIPVGSVLECRDIIQAIAKGEKVNNENFMMELENCFYNDEYSEIDSLGFDIISPSGYRAADARGQHSYANLFQ